MSRGIKTTCPFFTSLFPYVTRPEILQRSRQFRILTACDKTLIEVVKLHVHVRGESVPFCDIGQRSHEETVAIETCIDVVRKGMYTMVSLRCCCIGNVSFYPPPVCQKRRHPMHMTASEIPRTINCKASPLISFFRATSRSVARRSQGIILLVLRVCGRKHTCMHAYGYSCNQAIRKRGTVNLNIESHSSILDHQNRRDIVVGYPYISNQLARRQYNFRKPPARYIHTGLPKRQEYSCRLYIDVQYLMILYGTISTNTLLFGLAQEFI